MNTFRRNGIDYNTDAPHGSPFDRGSADSYYCRLPSPHYYIHNNNKSVRYEKEQMTPEQIQEYYAGYDYNEQDGIFKDYGKYD